MEMLPKEKGGKREENTVRKKRLHELPSATIFPRLQF